MSSKEPLALLDALAIKIYEATGIRSGALISGAEAIVAWTFLMILLLGGAVLILFGTDWLEQEASEPSAQAVVVFGVIIYLALLLVSAYGGFVAARAAGEQELLHALLAPLVASLLFEVLHVWIEGGWASILTRISIKLPHILAAGVGGFVVMRRRRRLGSE